MPPRSIRVRLDRVLRPAGPVVVTLVTALLLLLTAPRAASAQSGRPVPFETIESARFDGFDHVPQTQENWCWAAMLASVVNVVRDDDLSACRIASRYFGRDCCRDGGACDFQNSMLEFDGLLRPYGVRARVVPGRIGWAELTRELANSRPVVIRVESPLGQGHFVMIAGYDVLRYHESGRIRRSVVVSDPMYGYFVGEPYDIGYRVSWEELQRGELLDYRARWTHTALFDG